MPRYQFRAGKFRWWLLGAVLICWLAGIFWVFNTVWPHWPVFSSGGRLDGMAYGWGLEGVLGIYERHRQNYLFFATIVVGVFLLSQWLFLRPARGWSIRLDETGRPLRLSVLTAALIAALLSAGLLATGAEWIGIWNKLVMSHAATSVSGPETRCWPVLLEVAALWTLWTVIFFLYWRNGNRGTQLGRMLRGLFAGSILDLLVAAPVHVLILQSKSKGRCYCKTGSYTGLVLGVTVLFWTFGPGIVLLFLREARRRRPLLEKLVNSENSPKD